MADLAGPALLRLMTALSPTFPTGGFSYSHGLERAVHDGLVHDPATLQAWLHDLIAHGSGWNDAVLLAAAWHAAADIDELSAIIELGAALAGSRERHAETTLQGAAFARASQAWGAALFAPDVDLPYSIAIGAFARCQSIALQPTLAAFLQAFASSLIQAALRLAPVGQTAGLSTLTALEPAILATAERAEKSTLEDLGTACVLSEITAMRHETQYSRIFRS